MSEEALVLLVAYSCVYEYESVAFFDEEATHGPGAHVFFVCWVSLAPEAFGYDPKHGASV